MDIFNYFFVELEYFSNVSENFCKCKRQYSEYTEYTEKVKYRLIPQISVEY